MVGGAVVTQEYAERIVGLSQGKLVFDGLPNALKADILEKIYGSQVDAAVE